jgi:hypothetical protein
LIGFIEIGAWKAVVPKRDHVGHDLRTVSRRQRVEEVGRLTPPCVGGVETDLEHTPT